MPNTFSGVGSFLGVGSFSAPAIVYSVGDTGPASRYWSSSQAVSDGAYGYDFNPLYDSYFAKNASYGVKAIRYV